MTLPKAQEPAIVLVVDEVQALDGADVPTGLRAHLEQVLIAGRPADVTCLTAPARPTPAWLDAGELATLTSALVAAQVRQATSPA